MAQRPSETVREVDAVVVGAGISGICAGVTLRREGITDFVILTKAGEFGGTWETNTYPGVACDVPSQLYSFGFAPNREWSRVYSEGAEIQRYLLGIVEEHDLRRHARFHTELLNAAWDQGAKRWAVSTSDGRYLSRFLILGTGSHHATKLPDIPGLDTFTGRIFHSSDWPAGYDGAGDRVAILGTGASSIQITPALAPTAEHVTVFQRTPAWVLPKPDWAHTPVERLVIRRVPGAQRALRALAWLIGEIFLASVFLPRFAKVISLLGRLNILLSVRDRRLRKALVPDYVLGCKRGLVSNAFYRSLNRPDVDLIPSAAVEVRERSVMAADGTEVAADTIVLATGFYFTDSPIYTRVADRDGVILADRWKGHPAPTGAPRCPGARTRLCSGGPTPVAPRRLCSSRPSAATSPRRCGRCAVSVWTPSRSARRSRRRGRRTRTGCCRRRCRTSADAPRTTSTPRDTTPPCGPAPCSGCGARSRSSTPPPT